jgi:2-keto-4-pentenoate hydratase/2-oxohepta-3-ene-1,7-dioic acid hydratase in catechol pathway
MKLCRATHASFEGIRFGTVEGSTVHVFEAGVSLDALATSQSTHTVSLEEVTLVAPVAPSKIVCVGRNYREHAAELGNKMPEEPLLFLKAPSSVVADGDMIELPSESERVEHEGELGVVIGRRARNIPADENPLSYVLGYTCVNDVTARDLQRKDVQFTRAKSFDSFCPVGPVIACDINPLDVEVTTRLNGDIKQRARTSTMAFSVPFLIRYIAQIMTLYAGDLIATGTPAGVSPMKHGDVVEIEIEGIGVLRNRIN